MPQTATRKGFPVGCIHCGEAGSVLLNLNDVEQFSCTQCSNDFTADDVRKHIRQWQAVLAWLAVAPENPE